MPATLHTPAELESIRRSAAMAPLPPRQVAELPDGYVQLAREREQLHRLLAELGPAWRAARAVLNRLSELTEPDERIEPGASHGRPDPPR